MTGEFTGIFHDITETLGERLGLEIVWAEEVGWDGIYAGLEHGRFDAVCSGIWPFAPKAREADFSNPLFLAPSKPMCAQMIRASMKI